MRRSIARNSVVVLIMALGTLAATAFRIVPNPDFAPAVAFTDRLEAGYRSVVAGTQDLEGFRLESDGFMGATVEGLPAFQIETGEPSGDPSGPVRVSVLIGDWQGTCYSVRWEAPEWPVTGILRPSRPCTPDLDSVLSSSYTLGVSSPQPGLVDWDPLLPEARVQASWYFPVMLALLAGGLLAVVDTSLTVLRAGRGLPLVWENGGLHRVASDIDESSTA